MNSEASKLLGLRTARKWFIQREAPQTAQALAMMLPEQMEESPSWLDIMDYASMTVDENGILHVEATAIKVPPTLDFVDFSVLLR